MRERIALRSQEEVATPRVLDLSSGVAAHHVALPGDSGFNYAWRGTAHYLAWHDLQLRDGEVLTDDGRGPRRTDLRGTLTFVPADCRIWGWSLPAHGANTFTALYFDPSGLDEEVADRLAAAVGRPYVYFYDEALYLTFRKLHALFRSDDRDPLLLEGLASVATAELCRSLGSGRALKGHTALSTLSGAQQLRLREYVDAHIATDIRLADLSALVGVSRFHFLRLFKMTMNETPYQFVVRQRVQKALSLLEHGERTVAEVAAQVGFRSSARFIRTFRRIVGTTPGAFARKRRENDGGSL